jgi:hypothetical protein
MTSNANEVRRESLYIRSHVTWTFTPQDIHFVFFLGLLIQWTDLSLRSLNCWLVEDVNHQPRGKGAPCTENLRLRGRTEGTFHPAGAQPCVSRW